MSSQKAKDKAIKPKVTIKAGARQAAQAATAPAPVRRYRAGLFLLVVLVITVAFAVLTFLVKTTPSIPLDLQITLGIQAIHIPSFGGLMIAVSWPGFLPQSVIVAAAIIGAIFAFGYRWEALVALVAAVFSTLLNLLVKDLVHRPRPTATLVHILARLTDYSFPSGHVMFYIGFFGFITFLAFTLLKPSLKRTFLLVLFGLPVLLIGVSRILRGEHWASDVLGAYLLGSLTLLAVIQVYRWGKPRFFVHQPVAKPASSSDK